MKDLWNSRYQEKGYTYGIKPNEYFKEKLSDLKVGTLLLPAEGQGRMQFMLHYRIGKLRLLITVRQERRKRLIWPKEIM